MCADIYGNSSSYDLGGLRAVEGTKNRIHGVTFLWFVVVSLIAGLSSGLKVDQAVFAYIRDGKIAELWEIVDTGSLREQLGESR